MKKVKSTGRRSAAKSTGTPNNFEDYLAGVPKAARGPLKKMRAAVRSAVPRAAKETISYRIPAFKQERVLVWFAGFSNHCSLFPTASVIQSFKDELKGYKTAKGTIQFPLDEPLPTALIKKIVKARVAESSKQ